MMQRKHFVLKDKKAVRKASMQIGRQAESVGRNDKQLIREYLTAGMRFL